MVAYNAGPVSSKPGSIQTSIIFSSGIVTGVGNRSGGEYPAGPFACNYRTGLPAGCIESYETSAYCIPGTYYW